MAQLAWLGCSWMDWLRRLAGLLPGLEERRGELAAEGTATRSAEMPEHDRQEALAQIASRQQQTMLLATELEWCRRAGFTRAEWRRLRFMRWLHRQGRLTEFPQGHHAVPVGAVTTRCDEFDG